MQALAAKILFLDEVVEKLRFCYEKKFDFSYCIWYNVFCSIYRIVATLVANSIREQITD